MRRSSMKLGAKLLCLLLIAGLLCSVAALPASAAGTPTSLGLAAHGIMAYRDGWKYVSGAKGSPYGSTRSSDCAGLLYAYFSDLGAAAGFAGGATSQVTRNCVFSNDLSEGLPRIHGLALTMPDYRDPYTGVYGHIGIYIGNNEACDNSDYTYNMRRGPVLNSSRGWTAWHVVDQGMKYAVNGWYELDGKMVHYTNYEYDVNVSIDGYTIGSDGYACFGGVYAPVDNFLLSSQWASASAVAAYLKTKYSGVDTTYQRAYGGGSAEPSVPDQPDESDSTVYNGRITGSGVNLRRAATTESDRVTNLSRGTKVQITGETTGQYVSSDGKGTDRWYAIVTSGGATGYISALYAEYVDGAASAPVTADPWSNQVSGGQPCFSWADGYVTIKSEWPGATIFYTTDNSEPNRSSSVYTGPVYLSGRTFRAVAVTGSQRSATGIATVMSGGAVFSDVSTSDWFYPAVDYAVGNKLFGGTGSNKFSPGVAMTRGMFVTVLGRMCGVDTAYYPSCQFEDVGDSDYYAPYIQWAVSKGLVSGTGGNSFSPNRAITREQMALILYRFAEKTGNDMSYDAGSLSSFADADGISPFAREALMWAAGNKVLNGSGGKLNPQSTATRAQVAQVFKSCLGVITTMSF